MKLLIHKLLLVTLPFALLASAQAQNYSTGLVAALNAAGLTSLSTVLGSFPPAALAALQQGNHTVFAPSNAAIAAANTANVNITDVVSYHVTAAPIDVNALNTSDTIVRTTLGTRPSVLLPGGLTQVLAVTKAANGTVSVENAGNSIPVTGNATYQNLNLFIIDTLLQIPANLSTVVTGTADLSALVAAVSGPLPGSITTLDTTPGVTLFAPINSAITAIQSTLAGINATVLTDVLLNHLINGTALYSPLITNGGSKVSAGGQPITFTVNTTGVFVTSGPSTAKVVQPNILTSNGVIHLIDTVLLNTANNPAAAASAYSSATATSTTGSQTGAVTPSPSTGASLGAVDYINFKLLLGVIAASILGVASL